MAADQPGPIDRAALERIIQRATELQTSEREIGDSLTQDEVLSLGKEVGIPGRYLQQAMLEERARLSPTAPAGPWERFAGPGMVTAQRVVAARPEDAADVLVAYLEQEEPLCVRRRQPTHIIFEQISGFQAAIRRSTAAFGGGKKAFMLGKVETVTALLTPLEEGFLHVALQADVNQYRGAYVGGGTAAAAFGTAAAAVLLVLGAFPLVAIAPLPLGLGLGYAVIRQYPPKLARVQLGLEVALDQIEHVRASAATRKQLPPRRQGLLGQIVDEVRRNMKPYE